ncbi:hypothetical protein F2P81_014262 [Scophthalmus maximus]|uniref:Uncharacterized protein n=1 Tax=Scophthalmus maximus TaxID=52904 RepID=A0A6A4SGB0_SCOMX|nr:hypothetical protein F2P81_014262 [Scophthalmus maximus]
MILRARDKSPEIALKEIRKRKERKKITQPQTSRCRHCCSDNDPEGLAAVVLRHSSSYVCVRGLVGCDGYNTNGTSVRSRRADSPLSRRRRRQSCVQLRAVTWLEIGSNHHFHRLLRFKGEVKRSESHTWSWGGGGGGVTLKNSLSGADGLWIVQKEARLPPRGLPASPAAVWTPCSLRCTRRRCVCCQRKNSGR